jgi:phospholipid-binding lipoprotein MlaA
VPSGPYFVIPFFGPSSVRDGVGLVADGTASPVTREIQHVPTRNSLYALWAVDKRAGLLQADEMLESMALDKYSFTRDAYLQLRARRAGHEVPDGDEGDAGRLPREDE